jgi:hypothetical protein
MFYLVRYDTPNYGWVLSAHRTIDAAETAYAKKSNSVRGAHPHLMWAIHESDEKYAKGRRIRVQPMGNPHTSSE